MARTTQSIGNLNGGWAFLTKLVLALAPILFTAGGTHAYWATTEIIQLQADMGHVAKQLDQIAERQQVILDTQRDILIRLGPKP